MEMKGKAKGEMEHRFVLGLVRKEWPAGVHDWFVVTCATATDPYVLRVNANRTQPSHPCILCVA